MPTRSPMARVRKEIDTFTIPEGCRQRVYQPWPIFGAGPNVVSTEKDATTARTCPRPLSTGLGRFRPSAGRPANGNHRRFAADCRRHTYGQKCPKAATRRMANRQPEGFTIEPQKFMISATRSWSLTMTRFMFLVLERHRVVAPTSARPLAAPVPAL